MILRIAGFVIGAVFLLAGVVPLVYGSWDLVYCIPIGLAMLAYALKFKTPERFVEFFYIQVFENHILIRNASSGRELNLKAEVPFSSQRLLLAEYEEIERLVSLGVSRLRSSGAVPRKLVAIIHPMEKAEGGLSGVERRPYYDLADSAGFTCFEFWVGPPLSDQEAVEKGKQMYAGGA